MSDAGDVKKPYPAWKSVRDYVGCGVLVIGGFVAFAYGMYSCQEDKLEAAHAFFGDLRAGRVEQAYQSLAAERRAELSLPDFRVLVAAHPVLGEHTESAFGNVEDWGPAGGRWHACTAGELTRGDEDWYVEVHLTRRDDEPWRVHEWATARPRAMQETLLRACRRLGVP